MKYIYISLIAFFFCLKDADAQLIRIPKHLRSSISQTLYDEKLTAPKERIQYCFELELIVKYLNKDSVAVVQIRQLENGKSVSHFSDLDFIKKMNFSGLVRNKEIKKVHIPIFYSMVNRVNVLSNDMKEYFDFWEKTDDMFVRNQISRSELYTEPITIFGSIYE